MWPKYKNLDVYALSKILTPCLYQYSFFTLTNLPILQICLKYSYTLCWTKPVLSLAPETHMCKIYVFFVEFLDWIQVIIYSFGSFIHYRTLTQIKTTNVKVYFVLCGYCFCALINIILNIIRSNLWMYKGKNIRVNKVLSLYYA